MPVDTKTSRTLLRKRARVEQAVYRVPGKWEWSTPKNHEQRAVPIPSFLVTMLAKQCEGRHREDLLFGNGLDPLPAPGQRDGWLPGAVKRVQAKDEGFPKVTPHQLRHTAASLAISAGANVKVVQRMLGHKSAAMTLDTYADLFESDVDEIGAALDAARVQNVSTGVSSGAV